MTICRRTSAPKRLHSISRGTQKIVNIIDELLLLAGVRRTEVQLAPLNMARVIREVWQRVEYMLVEYQAEVIVPETWPMALGYAPWIEEVWVNYLTNACKYGGQPPHIELGADAVPHGTEQSPALVRKAWCASGCVTMARAYRWMIRRGCSRPLRGSIRRGRAGMAWACPSCAALSRSRAGKWA